MATEKYECHLDEELREIARIKVNENPEDREKAIERLRSLIKQENLVLGEACTVTLLKFLRYSKFDVDKSLKRFQVHYKSRMAIPEWFSERDPLHPITHQILKMGLFIPLKYDYKGRRVLLSRLGHYDAAVYSVHDVYKVSTIVSEYLSSDEKVQIHGYVNLCDFSKFATAHAMTHTPATSKIVSLMQDCFPLQLKGIYCWNTPGVFITIYNISKLFLNSKTRKRFQFLPKNEESLHELVPPSCLPNEYGGTAGPIQTFIDSAEREVLSYRERLLFDDDFLSNKTRISNSEKSIVG